ncbi:MAG: hypothetical protein HY602_00010 [Parcubacteria group bacterium]|nr:hypothetical protein [Parcubacteria group bacterium]
MKPHGELKGFLGWVKLKELLPLVKMKFNLLILVLCVGIVALINWDPFGIVSCILSWFLKANDKVDLLIKALCFYYVAYQFFGKKDEERPKEEAAKTPQQVVIYVQQMRVNNMNDLQGVHLMAQEADQPKIEAAEPKLLTPPEPTSEPSIEDQDIQKPAPVADIATPAKKIMPNFKRRKLDL